MEEVHIIYAEFPGSTQFENHHKYNILTNTPSIVGVYNEIIGVLCTGWIII